MKKKTIFKLVTCMMLVCILIMQNTVSVNAWHDTDHKSLLTQVVKDKKITSMSQKELKLLYRCVELPDNDYFRKLSGSKDDEVSALHGRKNYIQALKYIYEIAFEYLGSQSGESYTGQIIDKYYKKQTKFNGYDRKYIEKINTSLKRLLNYDVLHGKKTLQDSYEKSNRKKAIKVMGFCCHLAGDIFAHMYIVPVDHNYKQSTFKSTSKYSAKTKYDKFTKMVKKYEIAFANLSDLTGRTVTARNNSKGEVNIYDDKEFPKDLVESISKDFDNKKDRADDVNFHKSRISGVKVITGNLLAKFNAALTARDKGKNYSKKFDINTLDKYKNNLYRYTYLKNDLR